MNPNTSNMYYNIKKFNLIKKSGMCNSDMSTITIKKTKDEWRVARIFKSVEGCCWIRLCVVSMVGHLIRGIGCFGVKMMSNEISSI
jgi:hypothetical protein